MNQSIDTIAIWYSIQAKEQDDEGDHNDDFKNKEAPEAADAGLGKQNLELAVKFNHIRYVLVNSIVDFVEHLILEINLVPKVLILVIELTHNI